MEGLATLWALIVIGAATPLGVIVIIVGALVIVAQLRRPAAEPDEGDDEWWDRQW